MKVLLINGSARPQGCTARALKDVEKDLEGLQTMRNLGRNMAFLVKSIALGKEQMGMP